MKSVSFKTVGCRLNQAETAELAQSFAEAGFLVKPFGTPTDAIVIHTCAVTSRAEKDCARIARSCKKESPSPFVVLTGCAAEVSRETLQSECAPDLIVGQADKFDLPRRLAEILAVTPGETITPPDSERTRASVKVQSGCDFCCTYCIVPAARGRPISVPESQILDNISNLADAGFKEVVLTGANLGCYGEKPADLISLLVKIEAIERIQRIRLSSIELTTAEDDLITHMRSSAKICRHLHVPLQSGSNSVLARMKRKYTAGDYRAFCEYALQQLPDLALGADVIVGFPGETDTEFEETFALIEQLPFANMHIFQYSIREGTPAASMEGQVAATTKKRRSDRLLKLANHKKAAFAKGLIGKTCSVLIEKIDDSDLAAGWTTEYVRARLARKQAKINEIVDFVPARAANGILLDS